MFHVISTYLNLMFSQFHSYLQIVSIAMTCLQIVLQFVHLLPSVLLLF